MRLIEPKFEIIEQQAGLEGIYKQIELAGRTCYKSEDKITPDSAKGFVERMIKSEHGAMLEHGTIYLYTTAKIDSDWSSGFRTKYKKNKYSKLRNDNLGGIYVTTNLRVLVENGWLDDLKYLCEPTYHERRVTVRFTTEVGITREFNRHRVNSPAEESTRYCNYTKNKFGNEISVAKPQEFSENEILNTLHSWNSITKDQNSAFRSMCISVSEEDEDLFDVIDTWLFANLACEWSYFRLINLGWKPQQARKVLPLDLKSELVHTAFVSDWEHFFKLRDAASAHPDAQYLAKPLHEEFINRSYI